jgi:hypothetical protein
MEPTYKNQLAMARELLAKEGEAELGRHALVAIRHNCKCGACFCCAARQVLREHRHKAAEAIFPNDRRPT